MSTRIACKVTRFNWSHRLLCWAVTLFMLMCLSQVGLLAQACIANPTNYMVHAVSAPMPVSQANIVPIVDERIQSLPVSAPKSSVFQEGFDYGKSLWDSWYDPSDSKVWALAIAFVIAVMVIAYMVYKLIQLLDKVIPPANPPTPPPQSPTNSPPVVVNPNGSPGPAMTSLIPHKMMVDTNQPAWGVVTNYDISSLNYENTSEKFGVKMVFDHYWSVGMSISTNLIDWEDSNYQIEAFITSNVGVYYRYLHYGTNYYNCYYSSGYVATNHNAPAFFNLTDKPYKSMQFFRLIPR